MRVLEGLGTLFGELPMPDVGTYFTPWYGGVVQVARGIGHDGSKLGRGLDDGVIPDPDKFVALLGEALGGVSGNVVARSSNVSSSNLNKSLAWEAGAGDFTREYIRLWLEG